MESTGLVFILNLSTSLFLTWFEANAFTMVVACLLLLT